MLLDPAKTYIVSSGPRQIQAQVAEGDNAKLKLSQDGLAPFVLKEFTQNGVYLDHFFHSELTIEVTGAAQVSLQPNVGIVEKV